MSLFAFQDIITAVTGIILLIAMAMAIRVSASPASVPPTANTTAEELQRQLLMHEQEIQKLRNEIISVDSILSNVSSTGMAVAIEESPILDREIDRVQSEVEELGIAIQIEQGRIRLLHDKAKSVFEEAGGANAKEESLRIEKEIEKLRISNRILFNAPLKQNDSIYLVEIFPNQILIAKVGRSAPPVVFNGKAVDVLFLSWTKDIPHRSRFILFAHPGATELLSTIRQGLDNKGRSIGFDLLPSGTTVIDPQTGME